MRKGVELHEGNIPVFSTSTSSIASRLSMEDSLFQDFDRSIHVHILAGDQQNVESDLETAQVRLRRMV